MIGSVWLLLAEDTDPRFLFGLTRASIRRRFCHLVGSLHDSSPSAAGSPIPELRKVIHHALRKEPLLSQFQSCKIRIARYYWRRSPIENRRQRTEFVEKASQIGLVRADTCSRLFRNPFAALRNLFRVRPSFYDGGFIFGS